jgi:chromosome segregation ATPase
MAENSKAETLKILNRLSAREQEKTSAIAELTQLVEQGLKVVDATEKAVREALNAQYKIIREREKANSPETRTAKPAAPEKGRFKSKILDLMKSGFEGKIAKSERKIAGLEAKIADKRGEISASKKHVAFLQASVQKAEDKITGLRSSSELLNEARTKGNGFWIGLLTRKNAGDIGKLQTRAGRLQSEILSEGTLIKARETKIDELRNRVAELKNGIETQSAKIDRMRIIDDSNLPHAALTYFLTDRLGMTADELTAAIERPGEYAEAVKQNSETAEAMAAAVEIPPQETEFTKLKNLA